MSQTSQTSPVNLRDTEPANLTLLVLLLIPCVLLLLLLNCLFLAYKFIVLSRKKNRRPPAVRLSSAAFSPSLYEPVPPRPLTSSRAGVSQRTRLLGPDGATGSGSLRPPSTIRAASSPRPVPVRCTAAWGRGAPPPLRSSFSETTFNLVPPNSPALEHAGVVRSSTYEKLSQANPSASVYPVNNDLVEDDSLSLSNMSCLNTTTVGPGLDSDFGASAGVSLRILSADSDGLSNGVLASALEWDYYDPCYVRQNYIPKHRHPFPAIHTKQYWV